MLILVVGVVVFIFGAVVLVNAIKNAPETYRRSRDDALAKKLRKKNGT